jgi:hypothetical protein
MLVILVLERQRKEDHEFEASLSFIVRPCLLTKPNKRNKHTKRLLSFKFHLRKQQENAARDMNKQCVNDYIQVMTYK